MTPLATPASDAKADDGPAIAELHRLFAAQRQAFLADPCPPAAERKGHLAALAGMVRSHAEGIRAAMREDFGSHPDLFTDLVEVLGVAGRAAYAIGQLDAWMAEDERPADPAFYGWARAAIRYQPKGVVGNIVPWSFPFDLSAGPLVEMLAAGNRVIIKPPDRTPACGELLRRMVSETFPEERVAVVAGGLPLAREFPALRWDHLLYTGSPAAGREVARAAAANLVPVTLELGGKCPAVLAPGSVDEQSVRGVIATKLVRNGQVCVSVDYALVPRAQVGDFVAHAETYLNSELPGCASSPDCTGIITDRHPDRIRAMTEEARASGARVISLGGKGDPAARRPALVLVIDPPGHLRIMREEVFGAILPVIPYDDLDAAVARISAGERPLGLYVFSQDEQVAEKVLRQTTSGGACVNICAAQGALPSLGFGGAGQAGSGRHHGIEGFREFSSPRGVVVRGTGGIAHACLPPDGPVAADGVRSAFDTASPAGQEAIPGAGAAGAGRRDRTVALAARWIHAGRRLDMQGLADELGVSRATLFRRAGSREELLSKAMWWLTERALALAAAQWEAERPPGALHSPGTGQRMNLIVSQSRGLRRLLDDEPALALRVLTDPRGRVQTGIVAFVEDLLRRDIAEFGLVPLADPGALAYALVRVGESFVYADVLAARKPDVAAADRLQRALIEGTRP